MKRQNQEYGQQLSQMITRRELSGTIKPYSRADYTPETEINQRIRQAQNRSKIFPGVRQRVLSSQANYEGNSLCKCMPFLTFSVFIILCYIKSLDC